MLTRLLAILFPIFAIVLAGLVYGRIRKPDMSFANHLNMDMFIPALVFATLAGKSFELARYAPLALGTFAIVLGSGLVAWPIARLMKEDPKTFVPPMMFNNSGNIGLPLAVLTFGPQSLPAAVIMFLVSNLLHFSFGAWLLDHRARLGNLWRVPVVMATMIGLLISFTGISLWPPLVKGVSMMGEISIPLLLFSLGVRLNDTPWGAWRTAMVGAVVCPVSGMLVAWPAARLLDLPQEQAAMLFVFGALPPAVLNYVFAERFRQEPDRVASIALIGNVASLFFLPAALAFVLPR
ncbi:MAG: AEC family transporter [Rhodocyclaceae bacterium]|nr:AEC family transporter [Rhodocyclaceae bacterium]